MAIFLYCYPHLYPGFGDLEHLGIIDMYILRGCKW